MLSIGTRPDVHGKAWAAHAHWLLGHDADALSACREAIGLARSIDHPFSLAVALAYGCITHQVRNDMTGLRDASPSCTSCATGTASPTTASGG